MPYADLHNHTTASDGDFSPEELVRRAASKSIKVLGITDHDSIKGLKDAINEAKSSGIQILCGVEATIRFKRETFTGSLHLLLYFSEELLSDIEFIDDLNATLGKGRGDELTRVRINQINKFFGPGSKCPRLARELTFDEVSSYASSISRRHFAMALSDLHGLTKREQVNELIGNDSIAYLPSGIDLSEITSFVKKYPVLKVLAHPGAGSFPGDSHYKEVLPSYDVVEGILPEFMDEEICGLDGIEAYYPGHTAEMINVLKKFASENDLLVFGGSDCHDDANRSLGVAGLTEEEYNRIKIALN